MNPYKVGFVFSPTTNVWMQISASATGNGKSLNTIRIDSINNDYMWNAYVNAAGKSKTMPESIVEEADDTEKAWWKTNASNKIVKSDGTAGTEYKYLSGETEVSNLAKQMGTSTTITLTKNSTSTEYVDTSSVKFLFEAGKKYRIYLNANSSSGAQLLSFTYTPVYQLTWDWDDGATSATPGDDYTAAGYYAKGTALTYPAAGTMSKAGNAFTGWSSDATVMPASDLTITAEWAALAYYDATFTSTKGVAPDPASDVAFVTLTQITGVDGWRNTGWIADQDVTVDAVTVDAGDLIANGKKAYLTDDTEFEAQWAQLYTITYNKNGADGTAPTEEDHIAGETFDVADQGAIETPANTAFGGWSYNTNTYAAGDEFEMPAANVTFTAIWIQHYTITYNKGANGTGTIAAGDKTEDVAFSLSSERFTRDGYVQVGWALTDGGAQAYSLGGTYTANADLVLYPVWMEAESYSFNYTGAKTISALEAEGWTFNSAIFDADPTDGEAYVNLVSAMNTAGLSTPKTDGSMEDNAIAFTKTTDAVATYDIGKTVKVVALNATLYGGSGKGFDQVIKYVGSDNSTVKKTYTNNLNAGNWKANNINKEEAVEDVRYIKIYGASKWVVMSAFSVAYVSKYDVNFAKGEGSGTMDAIQAYAGNEVVLPECTFTAPENKTFAAWTSEDVVISEGTFTMPASNVTVTASYVDIYAVNITAPTNGTLVVKNGDDAITSGDKFVAGATLDVVATPTSGYKLDAIKVIKTGTNPEEDVTATVLSETTLTVPAYAVTVSATFSPATALDNTNDEVKAIKRIENGMLVIEKNGKLYNAQGQQIR